MENQDNTHIFYNLNVGIINIYILEEIFIFCIGSTPFYVGRAIAFPTITPVVLKGQPSKSLKWLYNSCTIEGE